MPSSPQPLEINNDEIKQQKQPWWRWLITIASLALFVYVISKQGWNDFFNTLKKASLSDALAGLVLLFISRLAVAARWQALLQVSKKRINYWDNLKLTYAGLFATNFLPTSIGGDLVRFIGMAQRGIDSALVLASLIMDRVVGLIGMSVIMPSGVYLLTHPFGITLYTLISHPWVVSAGFFPAVANIWEKLIRFLQKTLKDLVFWLKRPKNLMLSLLFTFVHMLLLFSMLWMFLKAVGEETPYWVVASLYSLSYLATLIPLSIGGLGIQEMSITYLYSHFGGVSLQAGLALAVLTRMAFVLNSLPGALFLPEIMRVRELQKGEKGQIQK